MRDASDEVKLEPLQRYNFISILPHMSSKKILLFLAVAFMMTPLFTLQAAVLGANNNDQPITIDSIEIYPGLTHAQINFETSLRAIGEVRYDDQWPNRDSTRVVSEYGTHHTIELTDLKPGTEYQVMIRAWDEDKNPHGFIQTVFQTDPLPLLELPINVKNPVDSTDPVMSNIGIQATAHSMDITLTTDESAKIQVYYSPNHPFGVNHNVTSDYATEHQILLPNLHAQTQYKLFIRATDAAGNVSTRIKFLISTKPSIQDLEAPDIQFNTLFGIHDTSARLFWVTNETSDTKLWLSTNPVIDTSTKATIEKTNMVYLHFIGLQELQPNTTYYYVIASTDANGNQTTLTADSFTTDQ